MKHFISPNMAISMPFAVVFASLVFFINETNFHKTEIATAHIEEARQTLSGLTQVMPATAKQVARSAGMKAFDVDSLWVPETSIHIGSIYLGKMLKQFGHPGLAAAAYNAGPGAVSRWLVGATGPFDEFVEDIPYSETRGYVKRVLRSYGAYAFLYEPARPPLRVSLLLRETPAVR